MPSREMNVRDLMTTPTVTIGMDRTLRDAQRIFNEHKFHHLIVIEQDKVVGVISDRDLLKHISPFIGIKFSQRPQDIETLQRRIHQIMTRRLVAVSPDASAAEAARLLMRHRVSCLPVTDAAGGLAGIITSRDLIRWALLRDQEQAAV